MDNDLFDVFEDETASPNTTESFSKSKKPNLKTKKRQPNGDVKQTETGLRNGDVNGEDNSFKPAKRDISENDGDVEGQPTPKRQRHDLEPEPIVTDSFNTEQSREVAAAAGLQGPADGTTLVLQHQVRHQVSLPPDYEYIPINERKPPETPARTYPFTLDPFQQVAIAAIEHGESVLVSAHTSAGKTVVAEYAIAQCLKNNQRIIYTSPIKALSNQKYREFSAEFGDVGLMTGDVTINPTATCLVMTTEILRHMLYRGSEIMREMAWVVFDEIHYMRDPIRGVVWEETIILLPDKVRFVFLSATIPNAMQFAEWVTKTHVQPCHVVYTDFRPTPLQHYFFPAGADGIHLIVDEKGSFHEDNFRKAMTSIAETHGDDPGDINAKQKGRGKDKRINKGSEKRGSSDIYKLVKMIMLKNFNPVIVFSFAKRECEAYALKMSSLAFNDDSEKAMVEKVFNSATEMLSDEDRKLPQIQHLLPLLRRGIGIHHGGLLPLLKETIEILFQEGLIKVLFATETFSIGLNMPAKTVVFTSVRKFDGTSMRNITPSEFIQMSGRAGRRGLDDRGMVIMMIEEKMEPEDAKTIVRGEQDKLNSAFYLGYNMILNLLRVEEISPEFMLEHCFYQFQNTASVSGLEKELHELENEKSLVSIPDESTIAEYYRLRRDIDKLAADMRKVITHPNNCLQFMQPGRLVTIKYKDYDFGWAAVVDFKERRPTKNGPPLKPSEAYVLHVLLAVADRSVVPTQVYQDLPPGIYPPVPGEKERLEVVPVMLSAVDVIGSLRLFIPPDLRTPESRLTAKKALDEAKRRFPDGIAILDPVENMGISDDHFKSILRKIEVHESRLLANPLHNSPRLPELYDQYVGKLKLKEKIKEIKQKIASALAIMHLDELKNRKRVLRRLKFTNEADIVQLKSRVACEISTGDELVLSELLFDRFFNDLSPEMCAATLSCFVYEGRNSDAKPLSERMVAPYRKIQAEARKIAKVSQESKLTLNEEKYVEGFRWELMDVVYAWAKGAPFAEICKMTDEFEGNLIRLFRRLEELIRQMAQAGMVMGSEELRKKFEETLEKIRRDIVAAQSLYL